jgi:enoyl-CoA hydratase/carnithine racemase
MQKDELDMIAIFFINATLYLCMTIRLPSFGNFIEFSIQKNFGIAKLNRIERSNSFTIEFLRDLKACIEFCQQNDKIKGLILTAYGTSFTTGMDLGAVTSYNYDQVKTLEKLAADICKLLYNGKPAICAINGRTFGEGVVFLTCCDYRIAVRDSFFQMPEINSAIYPGTGCITLFSKVIGIPWTKKLLMFAEKIDAVKALEIGLIDVIVNTREDLIPTAMQKAKFLNVKNQIVLNAIKLTSNHLMHKNFDEAYKLEKLGSDWYRFEDKNQLITQLKNEFDWST